MISNGLRLLILQSACSTRPIIVGGWIRVRYLLHTWPFYFIAQHSWHIMYIDYILQTCPHATWAETIMLVYDPCVCRIEIDELTRMCSQNNLDKFAKKIQKHFSNEMKILSTLKTRIYPQ
jgi:hypothetical protein